ncbi:MAG: aminofutalosine synthase MqnE [Thermoguttaceae bacterium]|nr:aminofutalosine synthase MqnE [Thermoguttaceae bacterium]MBP3693802.1 aminofutalosine synthase MqnE [Thermoguttaceae bacterium]
MSQILNFQEALELFDPQKTPLHELGLRADALRKELCGETVFFNVNAHLNPTNVCQYRCALCAFSTDRGTKRAYRMTMDEMLAKAEEAARANCSELHIVSAVDPELPYAWYVDQVRTIHQAFPQLQIKAFTAVEIAWMAEISGKSIAEVLMELRLAGLMTLPGGGAEILVDEVRKVICAKKPMSETWLEVHRTAHKLGIPSTATILYGHIETPEQRVEHLMKLRELQAETGGFMALIPLAFHPHSTPLFEGGTVSNRKTSAEDDLRMIAASRIILHNFPHIKAYWISLGIQTAQIALAYGASDLDGTVRQEKIHHDAGSKTPECLSVEEIQALIREAGRVPVERDSIYRPRNAQGMG